MLKNAFCNIFTISKTAPRGRMLQQNYIIFYYFISILEAILDFVEEAEKRSKKLPANFLGPICIL